MVDLERTPMVAAASALLPTAYSWRPRTCSAGQARDDHDGYGQQDEQRHTEEGLARGFRIPGREVGDIDLVAGRDPVGQTAIDAQRPERGDDRRHLEDGDHRTVGHAKGPGRARSR